MMIGVSMAAAIIICIAAFIWLYVQIGPLLGDFVAIDSATGDEDPTTSGVIGDAPDPTPTPGSILVDDLDLDEFEPAPVETPAATPAIIEDDDQDDEENGDNDGQPDEDAWEPTHQIREGPNVNFRSGPNTISQSQGALSPGTPLRFLDEEEPSGGVTWMYFDIEDGTEGWIRDIDIVDFNGDDEAFGTDDDAPDEADDD
jgi:hypothetical protein